MKTQSKLQKKAPTATAAKTEASKPVEKKMKTATAPVRRAASTGPMGFPPYKEQKGEEYMSKRQLDYFRDVLNAWSEQLAAERKAIVIHMQEDPNNLPDLLDRAALEEEHKREWEGQERTHKLTIKIEKALARINQGEYGYCEKCGAEIGLLRLQVRPTATLCIDCKAIDEIREKQTGIVE